MGRILFVLIVVVFPTLYALVDATLTRSPNALPRYAWVFLTIFLPLAGPLLWFVVGRPRGRTASGAPDDDARFLGKLDDDLWRKRLRDRRKNNGMES